MANCEFKADISFRFEQDSMKDLLLQHYENFCKEFADAGFGECGPPKILLPQSVEVGGTQMVIDGAFGFDCELPFPEIAAALGKIQDSFKDIDPKPNLRVTLYDRDSHSRLQLYPKNDIEQYLFGF